MAKAKKALGRPSRYKQDYDEQARKLCLLGATDKELADFFGVTETTINNWKLAHKTFIESIRAGKVVADMVIANSLYKSAQDRVIPAYQAFKTRNVTYDKKGNKIETETVQVVEVPQAVPANDRSIKFWLINRTQKWKEKPEQPEEETNDHIVNVTIVHKNQDDD